MEGEEEGGIRLSKRFNDNNKNGGGGGGGGGEVDYKTKSGTAWSHSYLNQKPWHPLSYPNQRRKWISEQTHAQRQRRAEDVAREYAQEQEFFRQTALISKKEKEKIEMMKAVSFMYVRPPGYNAESAKAAEIADEIRRDPTSTTTSQPPAAAASSNSMSHESVPADDNKKPRPKDAFGRPLPTQDDFQVLTNAPRLETGVPARAKPFGIEVRNVKCLRCGKYGHQSGDRECPLKDVIMPNEESRLKRDDPLTAIVAQSDPSEPLKWELKQKPGMSPPRGGFNPDDPNQQIVAEDIFDEYGGFLSGGNIPDLLTNFSPSERGKKLKKSKRKRGSSPSREIQASEENGLSSPSNKEKKRSKEEKKRKMKKKRMDHSGSSSSDGFKFVRHSQRNKHKQHLYSSEDSDCDGNLRNRKSRQKPYYSSEFDSDRCRIKNSRKKSSSSAVHFHAERHHRSDKSRDERSYTHLSIDPNSLQRSSKNRSHHRFRRSDSYSE